MKPESCILQQCTIVRVQVQYKYSGVQVQVLVQLRGTRTCTVRAYFCVPFKQKSATKVLVDDGAYCDFLQKHGRRHLAFSDGTGPR